MTKLQLVSTTGSRNYEQLFDFDAFVSYASEDYRIAGIEAIEHLENKRGLKLCVHERDFQPGESIAYNISKGIHGSRKTLLFLSKSFLSSEWCLYELNIARMEGLCKNRNVILMIMLEDISVNDLSIDMVDFIRTYTYLEYPHNAAEECVDMFWNKCKDFITS
jgi:toll-like receptor 13